MANSKTEQARSWWSWRMLLDAAGLFLVVYAGLNIAGIVEMSTGIEGAPSVLVLASSLLVLAGCASRKWIGGTYSWFVIFMFAYLLMGVIPLVTGGAVDMRRVIGYSGTVIFCSAIYFWLLARGTPSLEFVLRVVQLLFLINCIAIMGSGYLSAVFAYDVPGERSSGFFHNANEAGVMALYLVVLIAAVGPATATWVTLLKLAIAVTAIALTFSKTAYLVLMLLIILYLIAQRYYFTLSVSLLSAISVFPLAAYIVSVNPLDLSEEQKLRLQQVLQVFSGEIDNSVTTGRIDLWLLGVERIGNTFPFGGGIGTLHRMEGGYTDLAGDWLGVHNTFLAVLGEGGLVPFLIMLVLLFVLAQSSFNSLRPMLLSGILVVFTADLFVTHEVFKIRIHSLMLAVLMAACALEDKTQLKPPLRLPRPS